MEGVRKIRVKESWAREQIDNWSADQRVRWNSRLECLFRLLAVSFTPEGTGVPMLIYWGDTLVELIKDPALEGTKAEIDFVRYKDETKYMTQEMRSADEAHA